MGLKWRNGREKDKHGMFHKTIKGEPEGDGLTWYVVREETAGKWEVWGAEMELNGLTRVEAIQACEVDYLTRRLLKNA